MQPAKTTYNQPKPTTTSLKHPQLAKGSQENPQPTKTT